MEEICDIAMSSDDLSFEYISFDNPSKIKEYTKQIVQSWREYHEKGDLHLGHFQILWRHCVPKIYSPTMNETCLNWNFKEDLAQDILFNTLDEFICNGDSSDVLKRLSELDKASSVCGRVFKFGEPTYSCRECGMDKTCVLCIECFKNSKHRHHKYKMGTSNGGGCCDCGDVEAWKQDPFCEIHLAGVSEKEQNKSLPQDLQDRVSLVFEAVLWYAYRLLSTEQVSDIDLGLVTDNFFGIDTYCTILYNDEVHTFDQVINTLTRVLKCNQRSSTEYVTNIDREGRAIVKCASFQHCNELKFEIEKYTSRHGNKALKVLVNHAYIIAHQIYAMKLLSWLEKYLNQGEGFRRIFSDILLRPSAKEPCIVKGILLKDSSLWKSARTQWHRLLISGMLLEYENKKALAKIFTKNYGDVMKDFIKDDHDHNYSVSSLSVQLFTVPTLAHHLIANDDVLYHLLNTFLSECSRKCNKAGKLEFERSPNNQGFKRALYMLYDLKYLLSSIPENWTDDIRKGFLHGMSMLLTLLTMMQGMDAVTRQVGQHMEYEPEWESGFNLHIKLAYCVSLAIEWCGTDKIVLIKTYRSVLKKLEESPCYEPHEAGEPRELADHSTACLHYDVASKPVSIHLPLTRFLAALHLYLEKFNLYFDGQEFQNTTKPTPVQIMEPVLRAQVMVAQVHAGMWRRNGYALLNTLFFYHNVKCRTEMLDRDITLLQIAASLIESNEFLIHILNKFNLINWAMPDFETNSLKSPEEDSIRQVINLVEELLHLLIVIIGERHMPGVSNCTVEDRIRKEIIQHLCIKPLPHSELVKTIPDDLTSREIAVDEVIQELADFKKPTHGTGKGVYELKAKYFDEFNVFFYHYTREELSKAEESQRERRKAKGQIECCPPPKLPKLTESFAIVVNLLQCDVMLHIMQTVLERCENLRARSYSESQLHKVLHLIGYALLEEESQNYPFFKFIENSSKFQIFFLMEQLLKSPRVDSHKGLLRWTLKKYTQVANKKLDDSVMLERETASDKSNNDKERRAKLAAERRAKLMAQMQNAQKNFIKENASLFENTNTGRSSSKSEVMETDVTIDQTAQTVALGLNQSVRVAEEKTYVCILCQEEEKVTAEGPSMVLAAFVQQATVLCQHKENELMMDVSKHDPLYLNANLGPAPHTSTCGHVMHSECWRKYFDNVMMREHRRPYRLRHPASFDVDKQEFLCPLCECLSNSVLPLVPPLSKLQPDVPKTDLSFNDWVRCIKEDVLFKKQKICHGIFKCDVSDECKNLHCSACIYSNGTSIDQQENHVGCEVNCVQLPHQVFFSYELRKDSKCSNETFKDLFPTNAPVLDSGHKEMIQIFAQIAYTRGLNVNPHLSDKRLAPMNWKSLAYTIHSIEVSLRDADKPLLGHLTSRQRDCIENFVRIVSVLGSSLWNSVFVNSHAINLLSIFFENDNTDPSILQWDSFGFLISLTFSVPSLSCKYSDMPVPTGGTLDHYLLMSVFICHIIKILVQMKDTVDVNMETDSKEDDISEVSKAIGKKTNILNSHAIWQQVKEACLPFLRCCVLFYHYLTEVPAPLVLTEYGGDTYENMCTYLDLPQSPKMFFESPEVMELVKRWCSHGEVVSFLAGGDVENVIYEPLPVPHLIDLPSDYSELINTVSTFDCPNSKEDSKNPSLCLVCGKILCSQSYCCQTELNKIPVGACNYHASKCGAGIGVFLRVRECEILFLAAPHRGCFLPPPYLDDYGETDQGLRRGNPLRLCPERYRKLQTLWLSHGIHEEIARSMETNSHIIATQWNLL